MESSRVILHSGRATARIIPGSPAPDPTSIKVISSEPLAAAAHESNAGKSAKLSSTCRTYASSRSVIAGSDKYCYCQENEVSRIEIME